jgi:hypothetical protein
MSTAEPDPRPEDSGQPAGPPPDPPPPPASSGLPHAPPLQHNETAPEPGLRSRLAMLGGLVGAILYLLLIGASFVTSGTEPGMQVLTLFAGMILLTIAMLVLGIALVIFQRTRLFAIGLLIAVAFGVFVSAGVCVAVVSTGGA